MANDPKDSLSHDRALRGLKPVQAAPILEARSRASHREEFHVVLGHQPKVPPPKVVEALCQGLGWDTWSTIRRLESPSPRIVRRESSDSSAQYWVGWMRELGLAAYAIPESRLAEARVHEAVSLSREDDALVVAASDGTLHRISAAETLCIVSAEIRIRVVRSVQSDGKVSQQIVRDDMEGTFDVHLRPGDTILRFRQSVLRYAEFMDGEVTGSMAQFAHVLGLVREMLPGVAFHGDFQAASGSLGESWRLLSRSRDVVYRSGGGSAAADVEVTENNELPLFHFWSLLLRFQHASR